jgi:protein-tyrosine-phosphatase
MEQRISAETFGVDMSSALHGAAFRLAGEFEGVFSLETVERYLHSSFAHFEERATVSRFLPLIVERRAHEQLRAAAAALSLDAGRRPVVLFLGGSDPARPRMAEGLFHHVVGDRALVWSAASSSTPAGLDTLAQQAMDEIGVAMATAPPRAWSEASLRAADVLVTVGCGEPCPVYAGKKYEDWAVSAPVHASIDDVRAVRDELWRRTSHLAAELRLTA